ncbi:cyclohexanecarboxylate-CoA ligase, partial [Rhizobiaceae sp. 2RAB30]
VSSDGRPVDGVEVLIADEKLNPMPAGKTGRLYFRGAQQFIGYYKKPGLDGRGPQGWFDTGDLAYMDEEGYIRIDGRTKDIIIRGGENVPVVEIEAILYRHPRVADAAVVGFPDSRMGERGCAFLVLKDGSAFSMDELRDWMGQSGAAKQYWPEAVEIVDAMPRTAS